MATRPRIYTPETLAVSCTIELDTQASIHLIKVLRLTQGDELRLFNGDGNEYLARISVAGKKNAQVTIEQIGRASCRERV